jgi:hypothetical protein
MSDGLRLKLVVLYWNGESAAYEIHCEEWWLVEIVLSLLFVVI